MDFTSLFKYTDIRIEQLQKEEIIDKKLKDSCCKKCPIILSSYLLTYRLINRKFSDKFQKSSIFNYPNLISENLTYCNDHLNDMEEVVNSCNPCDRLKEVIEKMKQRKI
jgi:hypothetical protein